uniref:Nucleoprotein n=1 Tax=Chestnut teal chaphamaparvovirus TaxID=2759402 RepID=A0A7D7B431_9VIRU|nr:nucleoprotein [Chestnut teal chaphamaparvovirus]
MTLATVCLLLDILNQAVNAAAAKSADAARMLLTAQQTLEACRNMNNPGLPGNSWIQGARMQQAMWAPDPCAAEQEAVDTLMEQGAAGGNQVATQGVGGAPAPQLATDYDPVPNLDPAISASEFAVPDPGAVNRFLPLSEEDLLEILHDALRDRAEDMEWDEHIRNILEGRKKYLLWCPWGGPGVKDLKWTFKYRPKNHHWIGKYLP